MKRELMFELISDWYASNTHKKEFLKDKEITLSKFDYWLKKYQANFSESKKEICSSDTSIFTSIPFPETDKESNLIKTIELRTKSGIEIQIFERC